MDERNEKAKQVEGEQIPPDKGVDKSQVHFKNHAAPGSDQKIPPSGLPADTNSGDYDDPFSRDVKKAALFLNGAYKFFIGNLPGFRSKNNEDKKQ
jgi:hypothetical protein